jgi:hypothetical protein
MTTDEYIAIGIFVFLVVSFAAFFFTPTIIAFNKKHKYRWIIFLINFAFGSTLIGWFGALIWSVAGDDIVNNER